MKLEHENTLTITICGSVTFFEYFVDLKNQLQELGFTKIFNPVPLNKKSPSTNTEAGKRKIRLDLINKHYKKIIQSDCILVVNVTKDGIENYIGGNTFLEMGFAFVNKKPIFLLNPIPEMKYSSEIIGMQPIVLNKDLSEIKRNLTKTHKTSRLVNES
jgi:nucleoside 2-deoxyribosyltransferase